MDRSSSIKFIRNNLNNFLIITDNIKVVGNEKHNKKPRSKNREKLMIERRRVGELESEINRLNEVIQKMKEENGNLVFLTQRLQLQEENRNLTNENRQLRRGKSQMDNVNRRLRQEKCQMENQIEQLRSQMENQIQQQQQEKSQLGYEIQQLRLEKSQIENENQQLRQEKSQEIENEIQRLRQENIIEIRSVVFSNEEVGRGAYGAVYKGDFDGTEVAVKGFHKVILSSHNLQILEREITIASQCRHPNLLQFIHCKLKRAETTPKMGPKR